MWNSDELRVMRTYPHPWNELAANATVHQRADRGDNPLCPDCNNMLLLQEGCIKCLSCGYSEC
jgi:hypothetical protein